MADLEKTVAIVFQGDDRLSPALTSLSKGIDSFGSRVVGITQPLADVAESILKTEAALAVFAAGGLAYALAKSIEFEGALTELKKVLSDGEAFEPATEAAINLSEKYGESATSILQSIADFKQAGYDLAESMDLTKNSMDLVIAGSLEAADASGMLIATLKGFRLEAADAESVTDALNAVSNKYATNVYELISGLSELSPIAKSAGLSFQETIAILTPVIEVFRSGDEAANALKTGLLRLVDGTKESRAVLEDLHVATENSNGSLRSAGEILFDVAKAFETTDESQKLMIASQLVGIHQAGKMKEVFDQLPKVLEVYGVAMSSAGSISEEVSKRLATSEVQLNILKQSFVNFSKEVGDQYIEASGKVVTGTTSIIQTLRDLTTSGAFDPIFNFIRDFATQLGADLETIAKNLPEAFKSVDFSGLLDSISGLGVEVKGLFAALFGNIDLSSAEGLSKAIQKVVDTIESLTRVSGGILEAFKPFFSWLGQAVDAINSSDADTKVAVGNVLGYADAINKIGQHVDLFSGALKTVGFGLDAFSIAIGAKFIAPLVGTSASVVSATAAGGIAIMGFLADLERLSQGADAPSRMDVLREAIDSVYYGVLALSQGFKAAYDEVTNLGKGTWYWIEGYDNPKIDEARLKIAALSNELSQLPVSLSPELKVEVSGSNAGTLTEFDKWLSDGVPDFYSTTITAKTDETKVKAEAEKAHQIITVTMDKNAAGEDVTILTAEWTGGSRVDEAKKALDTLPTEKMMEIKLQGEIDTQIAKIKADAETVQKAVEWQAKLDIAQAEAAAEKFKQASQDISDMFLQTGEVLGSLFDTYADSHGLKAVNIENWIKQESDRRDKLLQLETDLVQSEIKLVEAKAKAIDRGQSLITINGDGLEPELRAFMMAILKNIKILATEDNASYLLGIS